MRFSGRRASELARPRAVVEEGARQTEAVVAGPHEPLPAKPGRDEPPEAVLHVMHVVAWSIGYVVHAASTIRYSTGNTRSSGHPRSRRLRIVVGCTPRSCAHSSLVRPK